MGRSLKEIVELVVFGLIALLLVTGLVWLIGWVLGLAGLALKFFAGVIWSLLRFVIPIAVVAGLVYAVVRFFMNRNKPTPITVPTTESPATEVPAAGRLYEVSEEAGDDGGPVTTGIPVENVEGLKDSLPEANAQDDLGEDTDKKL
jgi:hypothetical protein